MLPSFFLEATYLYFIMSVLDLLLDAWKDGEKASQPAYKGGNPHGVSVIVNCK